MMKKTLSNFSTCFALFMFLLLACEENDKAPIAPNLAFMNSPSNRLATEENVQDWYPVFFAFSGDNLYKIDSRNHSITLVGNGWSGTESATVFNNYIFAVQGGHLWKCNLYNGVDCEDLGANWYGTPHLTNDDEHLYGIQGNRLWKVTQNGGFTQLGNGEWGGETSLNYTHGVNGQNNQFHQTSHLYISWGGSLWRVNRTNGSWNELAQTGLHPMIMPHWAGGHDYTFLGVNGSQFWSYGIPPFQPSFINSTNNWSGATSIALTAGYEDPNLCATCDPQNIYVLINGTIHYLRDSDSPWTNRAYQGTVAGISNVYLLTSHLAR
jgi:hypothetical protein